MCLIKLKMTSRLDRLFILLETGANAATKRAAAQQLGEAQRLHPHELHHLLRRVTALLKSTQWDTRISAAHAIQAIISQVPIWDPKPMDNKFIEDIKDEVEVEKSINKIEESINEEKCFLQNILNKKLNLKNFDISAILAQKSYLTGSEGNEYDLLLTENENTCIPNEKTLASNFDLHSHLFDIHSDDIYSLNDLSSIVSSSDVLQVNSEEVISKETLQKNSGLSRREINRARRKARQSTSKLCPGESDDNLDKKTQNQPCQSLEISTKKIKLDDDCSKKTWYSSINDTVIDFKCAVPDATGCWPESVIEWPFKEFAKSLLSDLFSKKWEIRHGAATAFRELMRLHGQGAGKSRNQTLDEMKENHKEWLIDAALRLLCVLAIDRFGDFISDQVVAPVRETCAQALGSIMILISNENKIVSNEKKVLNEEKNSDEEKNISAAEQNGIIGLLSIILNLIQHNEWEARYGALLALKYLLAVRNDLLGDILPIAFPAILQCLSDSVEDVGAMAASSLIPVAYDLPKLLDATQLEAITLKLWELLKVQDDLAAACNSFMGLLAAILSLPSARESLPPQPLSLILPRLWPFLNHPNSCVRKATLQTLETLVGAEGDSGIDFKERWGEDGVLILKEALQNAFQRVLIEHVPNIQNVAERVWEKLVMQSDLECLLHAACPLISTWLCLAMQPELIPFNKNLLVNITTQKCNISTTSPSSSELKIYIGGIETVPQSLRHSNVPRARCIAARMLGLLSTYIVKPVPGIIYSPDTASPSMCYAKVLLAHLNSKSALQRTLAALTMAHWATFNQSDVPVIPEILKKQLFICLNEYIYYDEIATSVSRLVHECRDYVATLKHYKYKFPPEINTDVINLDQIAQLTSISISSLQIVNSDDSNTSSSNIQKLKSKLIDNLEERRRALEISALASAAQQQTLHVTVMAALAGAATMLHCLPEAPQPLNPLIKPLMESIKREEDDELKKLSAKHLAHLIDLCVHRNPCPNAKIATNLSNFLCSDSEYTPRIIASDVENELCNGILTLSNRQKQAEKFMYSKNSSSGLINCRGLGRPQVNDVALEEIFNEEPESKAAKIRRQGAIFALTAIVSILGAQLPDRLPQLWNLMLPDSLRNYDSKCNKSMSIEEANQLVCNFQVLEVVLPSLDNSLFPPILKCLKNMCSLLANNFKTVRHMASRCIAMLASLKTKETMDIVVHKIIALLETNKPKNEDILVAKPNDVDILRQGASEALACLVETLNVNIVPYAVLFMIPLLGRMSDQNEAVRLTCSSTFATLVQLLPLDPGGIDTSYSVKEKAREHCFLEQLLNPRCIPDTQLTVSVSATLRSYQQQGLNWLNFLNQYQLHGVLCDDMGLGKTLQTLCIIALDHNRNKQAPSSLVVCPPTLTGHWVYEADKFFNSADLSIIQYSGNPLEREKMRSRLLSHKLVVASYDILRKDIEFFETVQWNYCVLDEGHIIKNGKTKIAKAAKKLRAYHRLILSGTPVQNNVLELWSLFDFLMPGFLGSEKQFSIKYSKPILACREPKAGAREQEAGALAMEALHRQVLPFLLRRNKEDVLKDLPPKITQDYYCDLSDLQKRLYEDFKTKHSATLINNANSLGNAHSGHIFEALRYLRNVCNHPKLVLNTKHPQYQVMMDSIINRNSSLSDIEHGAKLPALKQLLLDCGIGQLQNHQYQQVTLRNSNNSIVDNQTQGQLVSQHRALIFCQLKAMLDIVEHDLLKVHLPNITYLRLDGSIPPSQRHSIVTRFNADPSIDVLLLTTQVGGLGLNLTGADTVIFVEHDWNPMKDLQAMDRAHRIGQKKVVNVYRLITRHTLEEKIMGLQKFKLLTANTIISTENSSLHTMRTEQLLDLFTLNKEKRPQNEKIIEDEKDIKITGGSGKNRLVLEILPDLWEQQQYDDEYNLDAFLCTLKKNSE